ncbi:MAG: hypothetical protein RIQ89_1222 [Bacteroidota bacterium]|jgi:hypothetical protein
MKAQLTKHLQTLSNSNTVKQAQSKGFANKFFIHALELTLLFMAIFATVNTFAQSPSTAVAAPAPADQPNKLEFVKQNVVFNAGKVYLNWIATSNAPDCIYVIERSTDGNEYEPVGLKEGINSPLELLYSWVDSKPTTGTTQYRIKQINEMGMLVAQADPQSVSTPNTNPLFLEKGTKMVSVK